MVFVNKVNEVSLHLKGQLFNYIEIYQINITLLVMKGKMDTRGCQRDSRVVVLLYFCAVNKLNTAKHYKNFFFTTVTNKLHVSHLPASPCPTVLKHISGVCTMR